MKRFIPFFVFLYGITISKSQINLVPNPSFEIKTLCNVGLPFYPPWDSPSDGSPDVFDTCYSGVPNNTYGFQYPRTGYVYVGASLFGSRSDDREYLQVQLTSALIAGHKYHTSFYTSPSKRGNYNISSEQIAINNIGMFFNNTHVYNPNTLRLNYIPQINETTIISDTANWTLVSGNYIAQGGEKYITIGNFNTHTDTIGVLYHNNYSAAYYFIDDVTVRDCTNDGVEEMGKGNINIIPNPATKEIMLTSNQKLKTILIYNVLGSVVYQQLTTNNQQLSIDISTWNAGVYFVEVETEKGVVRKKVVKQ
ncbi:MAG: T9SS type A sorting domain-containing protein [Bacteroidota bacterium]